MEHAFQAAKLRSNEERQAWGFTEPKPGACGCVLHMGRAAKKRKPRVQVSVFVVCLFSGYPLLGGVKGKPKGNQPLGGDDLNKDRLIGAPSTNKRGRAQQKADPFTAPLGCF